MIKTIRSLPIIRRILIWKKSWQWTHFFICNSGVFPREFDKNIYRARIRKFAHTIEKGLALPDVRPGFGKAKIDILRSDVAKCQHSRELSAEVDMARNVLKSYVDWHDSRGESFEIVEILRGELNRFELKAPLGGTQRYTVKTSDREREAYDKVMLTRRSVRSYSPKQVPLNIIDDAIRVAWASPSVCNRQPWAVSISQNSEVVRKVLSLQSGNKGFDHTIGCVLIVLADTKAFLEDYELYEGFVDAGIFSSSLVNALHARNVGSCCLNLCVSHRIAASITRQLDIPEHYFPVMMLAIGYAAEDCEVAISSRGPSVTFIR